MSTEHHLVWRDDGVLELWEHSSMFDLMFSDGEEVVVALRNMSVEEVVIAALEMLKVASYHDPNMGTVRTHLGTRRDGDYLRDVLMEILR